LGNDKDKMNARKPELPGDKADFHAVGKFDFMILYSGML